VAGAQGDESDAAVIELGEDGLGGELGVEDQQRRVMPGHLVPVVGEGEHFPVLAGLGQVGVGVDQGVGAGVLGEEGQRASGALGPPGYVVAFQDRIVAPVHDCVEVQVERFALGEPGRQGGLVQGGQERGLPGVFEPVGVGGQRGGLRQCGQPGEQGGAGVGGDVVDVGDPPGAGELERQQRQDVGQGGNSRGGRVARGRHQVRDAQGDQVGDGQEQPGQPGLGSGGQRGEVGRLGAGLDLPGWPAAVGVGAAPQPGQPFGGDYLGDPGPVQRGALGGQSPGDLVDGVPGRAQLDDPRAGGVLGRGGLRAGPAGDEELPGPAAEVPYRRQQARGGVAGPGRGLCRGQALGQIGAQRLIPAVRRGLRVQEELPAGPGGLRAFADWSMLLVHHVDGLIAGRRAAIGSFRHELHGCKPGILHPRRAAQPNIGGNLARAVSVTYPTRRPAAAMSPHKTPAHNHEKSPRLCTSLSQPGDDYPPRKSALAASPGDRPRR
jgi:hypothetical protein